MNAVRQFLIDGFPAVSVASDSLAVTVILALGAKVVSIRHLPSDYEWMWQPEDFRGFFASDLHTPFEDGALSGWDECLPTVAPCSYGGRDLPDHGEIWTSSCRFDQEALESGIIETSLELPLSPLRFTRTLTIDGDRLRVAYRLENLSDQPQAFLWAMHPLFKVRPGDTLDLPAELRAQIPEGQDWTQTLELGEPAYSKLFVHAPEGAEVTLKNSASGRGLTLQWDGDPNPFLGLWLTRGGWHGHHHLAIEPTNAACDSLAEAVPDRSLRPLKPFETLEWKVSLRVF